MEAAETEIAIVGAGAAGIAAALECAVRGIACRVIEARARTGGRCWTDRTAFRLPFDIGASWVHAADRGNPFAEMALARRAGPVLDPLRRILLNREGQRLGDGGELRRFQAARTVAQAAIEAAPPGASLADCLPLDGPWARENRTFAGPWLCGTNCAETDAADWASAQDGNDWLLPHGHGALLQEVASGLAVTTDCALRSVQVRRDRLLLDTTGGTLAARHAVLTVPLGVLAAEAIRFDPPLPAALLGALDDLPMGCLMKIGFALKGDPLGETGSYYLHHPVRDESGVLYLVRPAGIELGYAFVGGAAARALERAGQAAAREAVLDPLRHLLGAGVVARTIGASIATRWGRDPWSLGSYAIARPGGAAARKLLNFPIHDRLHLAGEANAPGGWQATVGGAWLAGRAVVRRIVEGAVPG